jgi:hypothetical protein
VFGDTEHRHDAFVQWHDEFQLDTWVVSPIFPWLRETLLSMLVKGPAEYPEPVRGYPLAVIIVLEWSLGQHIPCRDVQGGLVVYLLAGVYASHEKSSKVASGFERPGP